MTEIEHLNLPLPPLGNHRNGLNLQTGRFYPTDETKKYRRLVQLTCIGMTPLLGEIGTRIQIHRRPDQRGDIDGYLKCLLDHLQGSAWANDAQIQFLEISIIDDGGNRPHVDVWFWLQGVPLGKSSTLPPAPKVKRGRASLKPNTYRPAKRVSHGKK